MKDANSVHKSVQEMCDCFVTTDPLQEMSKIKDDAAGDNQAEKWLALATLHGVNQNAQKITLMREEDGCVKVLADYRTAELPSLTRESGERVFEALREMTHIDSKKGRMDLALGIRDSSIDLNVKIKKKRHREKITIHFPEAIR